MNKILLVDDEKAILTSLHRLLRNLNADIYTAASPIEALELCEEHDFILILSDQRMPHMDGSKFLIKAKEIRPDSTRIIISAYSDFDAITEAFNDGTIHKFIPKPWDNKTLKSIIQSEISSQTSDVEENIVDAFDLVEFHGIYTQCDQMLDLFDMIKRVSNSNVPVNIWGETGTGKELVARSLHKEGNRKDKKFLAINCANLTPDLVESQLFGHKKGAFTGAHSDSVGILSSANEGTLFLDEVTCLDLPVQVKLLRALQEKEYYSVGTTDPIPFDVQVISASSISIEQAVESGNFRSDLRYRLEVIPIKIPALKDRGDDLLELFKLFMYQLRSRNYITLTNEAEKSIKNHCWPGNVRELYNAASFAHAMADTNIIGKEQLPDSIKNKAPENSHIEHKTNAKSGDLSEESIVSTLEKFKGNRSKSAEFLGISRMTLWRKIKDFDI